MTQSIWPNFFIVGAPRAGTTSLYEYLKQAPGVYMSAVKEPHYFGDQRGGRSESEYLDLFRGAAGAAAVGEASVGYLRNPEVPERIRRAVPHTRASLSWRATRSSAPTRTTSSTSASTRWTC